ncbi:cytochrome b5 domain-containing protein [Lysinibacillus sp. KU-BSD001]|uniref:cytochrome b5 domain-containing protein n=1 Tax=Lysinibacillus sp. KU-BSD001 TaxID=3141328 RepID=UPI0036DFF054
MQNIEILRFQLNNLVTQARQDIYTLSTINQTTIAPQILQRLWDTITTIHFISELLANQALNNHLSTPTTAKIMPSNNAPVNPTKIPSGVTTANASIAQITERNLTVEQLANFDGKNGRPAYVAVNGLIYDVTNNRAWAAATHFGLLAGKEYSQEFASCHAGQQSILATLPVVGRLV